MSIPYPTCYASNPNPQARAEHGCAACVYASQCAEAGTAIDALFNPLDAPAPEAGLRSFLDRAQVAIGPAPTITSAHQAWVRLHRLYRRAEDGAGHLDLGGAVPNTLGIRRTALNLEEIAGEALHTAQSLWPGVDHIHNIRGEVGVIDTPPETLDEGLAMLAEAIEKFRDLTFIDVPNPPRQRTALAEIIAWAYHIRVGIVQPDAHFPGPGPCAQPVDLPRPVTIAPLALARFQSIEDAADAVLDASQALTEENGTVPERLLTALRSALALSPTIPANATY